MADIIISCPIFGKAVPTGITTEMIILNTLDFFAYHAMSSLQKNPQVDLIRRMDRERAFLRGDDVTTVTQCRIDRLALVRYVI